MTNTITAEQQLLSKKAINLPPKERLNLLLKAKVYPIVKKRTSAEGQIKEMLDFYNFCCLMLAQYFPNKQAENNFLLLNLFTSKEGLSTTSDKLTEAFGLLTSYEELENRITSIQMLFYQYSKIFPDVFYSYNLEDIVTESVSNIIENSLELLNDNPSYIKKLMERWGIILDEQKLDGN